MNFKDAQYDYDNAVEPGYWDEDDSCVYDAMKEDFDDEFVRVLKEEEYLEVYSEGKYFYKESNIIPDIIKPEIKVPISINLISFDSLILDAKSRNSTFLELLKEGLKETLK